MDYKLNNIKDICVNISNNKNIKSLFNNKISNKIINKYNNIILDILKNKLKQLTNKYYLSLEHNNLSYNYKKYFYINLLKIQFDYYIKYINK